MANPFDQFDAPAANPFDQFDAQPREDEVTARMRERVKGERAQGGIGMAAENAVRTAARGTFVGPFLDEIEAAGKAGLNTVTGGAVGMPYDDALAYRREHNRQFDEANPVTSTALQIAGGVAGGGAAMQLAKAPGIVAKIAGVAAGGPLAAWTPAKSMVGNIAQGSVMGAGYGAASGFGTGEGGLDKRLENAESGAYVGGALGAVLPPVISGAGRVVSAGADALSPQLARAAANLDAVRQKLAIRASGGAGGPVVSPGADAAAEQMIANQLSRADVTVPQLRQRLADADEAARLGSNSRAQNVAAPVDLDPSLQRLAGSAARKQPEAGNIGQAFIAARQTGQELPLPLPSSANLPTRAPFAAVGEDDIPAGQFERMGDALKRAFQIKDYKFHGHEASAHRTEKAIIQNAKEEANDLYGATYRAGLGVNLQPVVGEVSQAVRAGMIDEPEPVARLLKKMADAFDRSVTEAGTKPHVERFDKVKQYWDGVIEKFFESPEGRNRYIGGVLNQAKNNYLGAIDGIEANGLGEAYKAARGAFSSAMEARDALRLGRDVFRDGSEVAIDQFRDIANPGMQKLFRLGMLDSYINHMGRQKRTADVTQVFESPRVQQILHEVIPKSETAGGVFANRPERFGRYVQSEKRMIDTRNEVFGNSKTAQRLADDQAYDTMSSLMEQAKAAATNPSASNFVIRGAEAVLNKLFGMRPDTAKAIAEKLYTADPRQRELLMAALERRMGPSRAQHFANLMQEYQGIAARSAAASAAQSAPDRR